MHSAVRLASVACVLVFAAAPGFAELPDTQVIPVYPNAQIEFDREANPDLQCCDFVTRDPLEKVLAFYEAVFKTKPVEPRALAARFPMLKPHVDEMLRQMPPQMRIRFFVLREVVVSGQTAAEVFEVTATPQGVRFNILAGQLGPKDAHHAEDWAAARKPPGEASPEPPLADTRRLAAALPATPPGYQRVDEDPGPGGAGVTFRRLLRKNGENEVHATINVSIEDARDHEGLRQSAASVEGPGERAVKVLGRHPGKESATRNEAGYESCEKSFVVAGRYIVAIRCENTRDLALVERIIGSMKLDALGR